MDKGSSNSRIILSSKDIPITSSKKDSIITLTSITVDGKRVSPEQGRPFNIITCSFGLEDVSIDFFVKYFSDKYENEQFILDNLSMLSKISFNLENYNARSPKENEKVLDVVVRSFDIEKYSRTQLSLSSLADNFQESGEDTYNITIDIPNIAVLNKQALVTGHQYSLFISVSK